jgi:hypothetical protein
VLAVKRAGDDDERWVLVNFSEDPILFVPPPARSLRVEITSGGHGALGTAGLLWGGRLGPEEAVILRPA